MSVHAGFIHETWGKYIDAKQQFQMRRCSFLRWIRMDFGTAGFYQGTHFCLTDHLILSGYPFLLNWPSKEK